jgi:hypothetical protein
MSSSPAVITVIAAPNTHLHVFVITSEATRVRRKHAEEIVAELDKTVPAVCQFITEYDTHEEPGQRGIDGFDVADCVKIERLTEPYEHLNPHVKTLHARNVSNARKHLEALRRAALLDGPSLVLEDDVIQGSDMGGVVQNVLRNSPEGWGVVMLGLPGREAGVKPLAAAFPVLPLCDSYAVTPAAARRLAAAFLPLRFPTNVQLSYVFQLAGVSAYMSTPNAFVDGSKYGVYASTVSANNPLLLNRQYVEARAILRDDRRWAEEGASVLEIISKNPFKNHPDFVHLRALYERRMGGTKSSELVFSTALKLYEENNCHLTNESEFLRDYISIFRDLQ